MTTELRSSGRSRNASPQIACVVAALLGGFVPARAADLPSSLMCFSNAKAARDYAFGDEAWSGVIPADAAKPFGILASDHRSQMNNQPEATFGKNFLRDKVFSGLDTDEPTVRSITRFTDGEEQAEEFSATAVSRFDGTVFLVWGNTSPPNKIWSAAVDLVHRKVTLTQVFRGATSLGAEIETLDCR